MTTKWPNLRPVDSPQPRWLDWSHHRRIKGVARMVKNRTGASAWVDTARAELCFGYPDHVHPGDVRLSFSVRLYRDVFRTTPVTFEGALDTWTEDDIVYCLGLARLSPEVKERWRRWHEASRDHDANEEKMREFEAAYRSAVAQTEREYERHSMGRHYRRTAAVDGLKGTG